MSELRVIRSRELSAQTSQTPGMLRRTAIGADTVGARGMWVGLVTMEAGVSSGAHHHGESESAIYMIAGRIRMRYGAKLEKMMEAGPGDFLYVPPLLIHQEINLSPDEPVKCIVVRDSQDNVVVNVDMPAATLHRS